MSYSFPPFVDYSTQTPITAAWLNAVSALLFTNNQGTTAQRPTYNVAQPGQTYFDTNLGYPVFCKSIVGTVVTWVNASGVQS